MMNDKIVARLRAIASRVRGLFTARRVDSDFAQELDSHLAMLTEDNMRNGMDPAEARRAARLKLGAAAQLREAHHDQRTFAWLESLVQDVRFALRMLRKNPGFTAVAVLTLALGIGANTAIFSVTYGILLKPLPYPRADRIVQIWGRLGYMGGNSVYLSKHEFEGIEQNSKSFSEIGAYLENGCCNIYRDAGPEAVQGARVSGNFFSVLGAQPFLGRPILPADDQPGHEQVAVITYQLWQQFFGGDPQIIGKKVSVQRQTPSGSSTQPITIVGVMQPVLPFPNLGEIFVPDANWQKESQRIGVARLKDGISLSQANAELQTIAAALQVENPKADKGLKLFVSTLRDRITENDSTSLWVLFAAAGFVLLLACINVGSLLIARCWSRQSEIAVRETLGATRARLLRQLLTESVLLAALGGMLGILFASWGISALRAIAPAGTPRLDEVAIDWHILAYTIIISFVSGLLFGIVPALIVSRTRPAQGLKETRAASFGTASSHKPRTLRNALVISEIALAFLLVTGATLVGRSFLRLSNVNMGYRRDHVLTAWILFSRDACSTFATCHTAENQVLQGVSSIPGVKSASFSVWGPLTSTDGGSLQVAGRSGNDRATFQSATPGYFEALGIPLLKGRPFGDADTATSAGVVIVNQSLAKAYLDDDPIGRRISVSKDKSGQAIWQEVVGEVGDTRDMNPSRDAEPTYYVPSTQDSFMVENVLIVRSTYDPVALLPAIRAKVWDVDKKAPIPRPESIDQMIAEKTAEPRFQASLLGSFGAIALLLSILGVYGVTSYSLAQRTHEMGVRVALGAHPRDILRLVLGEGLLVCCGGIAAGVTAAFGLTRYLRSLLFEIKPLDALTFVGVAVAIVIAAIAAYYVPARRATRVDPIEALRYE